MTNEASVLMDTDAANKAMDADAALQELGSDLVGEAYVTATVTVWDEDARVADERLRLVEKVIQGRDFTCMRETRQRGRGLARQPARPRLRQCPPAADLDPQPRPHDAALGGVGRAGTRRAFRRRRRCSSRKTEGSTPFRFSLHVGDVGHTLIVGPTGAGKSVLLALMALQFRRYPAPRSSPSISAARSAPRRSPWAATGTISAARWPTMSPSPSPCSRSRASTMPASAPGRPNGSRRCSPARASTITPGGQGASVVGADLARVRADRRSGRITGLSVLLQSNALKQALQPYTVGGPWGRLLDAESRAARRGRCPGLRDRGADRRRRGARRARPISSIASRTASTAGRPC